MTSSIQVAVYDDRVEISSPGTLYGALTIEEAVRGHSALRNPVLARTLEKIGVIEGWGSGLKRITELCKNYTPGFNHLEIQEIGDMLRFNIYRPMSNNVSNNGQNDTVNDTETANEGLNVQNEGLNVQNDGSNVQNEGLKKSERNTLKILELMQTNPSISIDELANSCNLTRDGINYYIKNLKKDGFIKRDGAKKNGYWEVLKTTL